MRDFDGVVRQVTKFGQSKAAAERALKLALRDRVAPGLSDITGETKVETLAKRWLAELPADRSPNTRDTHAYVLARHVVPQVGALRVREVNTPAVDRTLREVTAESGPGAAKTTRSVLSGMFRLAVRHGATVTNPVREAAAISKPAEQLGERPVKSNLNGHRAPPTPTGAGGRRRP